LIKKQIGLLAIIAVLVSFMAFTGVASAQTSNAQVVFFTSPFCSACQAAEPIVQSSAAKYGVTVTVVDVTASPGKGIGTANGVTETPTIVVSGAQNARFEGSVTQAQMDSALQAAIGTATPAAKATVAAATVAAATTPKATVAAATTPKATVAAATTPKATVAAATTPKATVAATDTSTYIGVVVASKATDTKYFHIPDKCIGARSIKAANEVRFPNPTAAIAAGYKLCPECFPNGIKTTTPITPKPTAQPTITVATTTPTTTTSTQTVPEFSLLGLGAPALIVGAIYLFLRRQ
jgi:thiol-disulfide isomerase/thioredoxin